MPDFNLRFVFGVVVTAALLNPGLGRSQQLSNDIQQKVDGIVAAAYQAATARFPCKVKTRGKIRMIRWQDADECLNDAANRVDWDAMSGQLVPLRAASSQLPAAEFNDSLAAAFSAHALPYEKVLVVNREDVHLPLTNSVLRFLPPGSFEDVPVIDKAGNPVGTFAGTYFSERTGGVATANTYRLALFQFKDADGNLQSPSARLLLDSYGVPWKEVKSQPGFRLTTEKLSP